MNGNQDFIFKFKVDKAAVQEVYSDEKISYQDKTKSAAEDKKRSQIMSMQHVHEALIQGIQEQQRTVLENSSQAIYIYLDGTHKLCNERFASMLGYDSPQKWADKHQTFTHAFVDKASHHRLVSAYPESMSNLRGSSIDETWKTRSGRRVRTHVILMPFTFGGRLAASHFIS